MRHCDRLKIVHVVKKRYKSISQTELSTGTFYLKWLFWNEDENVFILVYFFQIWGHFISYNETSMCSRNGNGSILRMCMYWCLFELPVCLVLEQLCPWSQSFFHPNPQLSFKNFYGHSERNVDFEILHLY